MIHMAFTMTSKTLATAIISQIPNKLNTFLNWRTSLIEYEMHGYWWEAWLGIGKACRVIYEGGNYFDLHLPNSSLLMIQLKIRSDRKGCHCQSMML